MEALDVRLPLVELHRRRICDSEIQQWIETGDCVSFMNEKTRRLVQLARDGRECVAYSASPEITLSSGEQAVIPVTWEV